MQSTSSVAERARDFLNRRTLALVGVSRNEKDYSRWLFRRLKKTGYQVLAVNPNSTRIDGEPCYKSIAELPQPVDGALLMTSESKLPHVIGECVTAGIRSIWIYGVGHPRKLDVDTRTFCEQHHVQLINGLCPMMFLRDAAWPHRFHGWIAETFMYRTSPA